MNKPKSRFQLHCDRWGGPNGCGSTECEGASKRVLCRGKIPCHVLFIGEASGESEDVVGLPFVGPAGRLLDKIISRSIPDNVRYALTNIVGCIPRVSLGDGGLGKASQPDDEQVESCSPRLIEFVGIAQPRLIVCVGTFARDWLDTKYTRCIKLHTMCPRLIRDTGILEDTGGISIPICGLPQILSDSGWSCRLGHGYGRHDIGPNIPRIDISHPSFILRQNVAQQGLSVQRAVVTIADAIEEYLTDLIGV